VEIQRHHKILMFYFSCSVGFNFRPIIISKQQKHANNKNSQEKTFFSINFDPQIE